MIKSLIVLFLAFFLAGCETTKVYVTRTEFKLVTLDAEHTKRVEVPAPPAKETFVKLTAPEQRSALANYSLQLQTRLNEANSKLFEIEQLQIKQLGIVTEQNAKSAKEAK